MRSQNEAFRYLGEALRGVPQQTQHFDQRALQIGRDHCSETRDATVRHKQTHMYICLCIVVLLSVTPGLRLYDLQLRPGRHLVVLPDLPAHAEAQRHHVVLLAVRGEAALDVVQQRRLQAGALTPSPCGANTPQILPGP